MSKEKGLFQKAWNKLIWNSDSRMSLENPQIPLSSPYLDRLWEVDNSEVNLSTSLSITAFFRAIQLRSETQASLDFNIYSIDDSDTREISKSHAAYKLLNQDFNDTMSAYDGRKIMQSHVDTLGNGFAEIIRDGNGTPKELWILDPRLVTMKFSGQKIFYEIEGQQIDGKRTERRILSQDSILHVKAFSFDGYIGIPPMEIHKEVLGAAIAENSFTERFFRNNALPSMVISVDSRLDKETADKLKESWDESYGGKNQSKTAILGQGAKVTPISMPLDQALLTEVLKHSVIEIARIFSIPPHLLFEMERETYTNIETSTIGWIRDCVRPLSIAWESEVDRKLLSSIQRKRGTHFSEHDLFKLQRGDSEAQANFYQSLWSVGAISSNEIRKLMNWNSIGSQGDYYMAQQGFAPVDKIASKMDADLKKTKKETEVVGNFTQQNSDDSENTEKKEENGEN